jgi:hypothetical protein
VAAFVSSAQEVLMPLRHQKSAPSKAETALLLPFFDDFSSVAQSDHLWDLGGSLVNQGYAPLPPTIGMVTLDAFDADGSLYPTAVGQFFGGDTLVSNPIRLDSIFSPFPRRLTPGDSVYLSFFYLPGGGYGNMWERVGDIPEVGDSLILELYAPGDETWRHVWSIAGCKADSLVARTGNYWQFVCLRIDDPAFLQKGFRFRFRNYCSLDNVTKKGLLSNADQWNVDYVFLNADRNRQDSAYRDVAFVNPAPSLLKDFQAMPARQYNALEMRDTLPLTITNLFSEELATNYGYQIQTEDGEVVHTYEGGYENAPVYWNGRQYQASPVHARPVLAYSFPEGMQGRTVYEVVHGVREGVRGDAHPQNDTIRFSQVFDNYYAYDDGTPENGYGITSTSSRVRLACQFRLNVEDTLTAVNLYFNRTLNDENADIYFLITVWDDVDGHPGNVIYQDSERRKPRFNGFNRYVRYDLEEPVVCNGTVYIGLEQTTADYINLGFDRNNDASSRIFFLTSASWQTSILRGALMLRPYFGYLEPLAIDARSHVSPVQAYAQGGHIFISSSLEGKVTVYDLMGRPVFRTTCTHSQIVTPALPRGIYLVKVGSSPAKKVVVL